MAHHSGSGAGSTTNPLPVSIPYPSSATVANVTASDAVSTLLLASNTSRKVATIFNDATDSLYLKFGTSASTSSFTVLILAAGYYELPQPCYTGVIHGIWKTGATGTARTTEVS